MKTFGGGALFLDRDNINTDEIIPAKYLTEISKQALKPYLLEDLRLDGADGSRFDAKTSIVGKSVIITRDNFGCGSSREHAPWALEVNGINAVFASGFARIFRQNMYNCGLLAAELSSADIADIFSNFCNSRDSANDAPATCGIIWNEAGEGVLTVRAGAKAKSYPFRLEGFDKALIESEGWVGYAAAKY
jgi:3-isopropylmalate/(R)-2-methylmalate dehydratase small subunit